jgi:hypothetical protein
MTRFSCVVKVKCRELVRKIATYKTTLAVSLDENRKMNYDCRLDSNT